MRAVSIPAPTHAFGRPIWIVADDQPDRAAAYIATKSPANWRAYIDARGDFAPALRKRWKPNGVSFSGMSTPHAEQLIPVHAASSLKTLAWVTEAAATDTTEERHTGGFWFNQDGRPVCTDGKRCHYGPTVLPPELCMQLLGYDIPAGALLWPLRCAVAAGADMVYIGVQAGRIIVHAAAESLAVTAWGELTDCTTLAWHLLESERIRARLEPVAVLSVCERGREIKALRAAIATAHADDAGLITLQAGPGQVSLHDGEPDGGYPLPGYCRPVARSPGTQHRISKQFLIDALAMPVGLMSLHVGDDGTGFDPVRIEGTGGEYAALVMPSEA